MNKLAIRVESFQCFIISGPNVIFSEIVKCVINIEIAEPGSIIYFHAKANFLLKNKYLKIKVYINSIESMD